MEIQPMGQAAYDDAVADLRAKRRLPSPTEFSSVAANRPGEGPIWQVVDFAVDLRLALREAAVNHATALRVYADVVRIPVPKDHIYTIGGDKPPCRLDIIARRLEIDDGDRVEFLLKDNPGASTTVVRLLVGSMTGRLSLGTAPGVSDASTENYEPYGEFLPSKYELPKGGPPGSPAELSTGRTRLGLEMLSKEGPLYHLLQGSYELAAGLTAQSEPDTAKLALARSILLWLNRWATYPSAGLIPLFQAADSLLRVLPTPVAGANTSLVYVVPGYSSADYYKMADSQRQSARDYDLSSKFQSMEKEIGKAIGVIVDTWAKRDKIDDGELGKRIVKARERVEAALAAVKATAKDIENQSFRNRFSERELVSVQNQEFVKAAVKAGVGAGIGIVQIVVGVATGVANPAAVDVLIRNTVTQLKGYADSDFSGVDKLAGIAAALYSWPISIINGLTSMDDTARTKMLGSASLVKSGLSALSEGAGLLIARSKDIKLPALQPGVPIPEVDEIGELVGTVANVMDPPAAKAAWDAYLAEALPGFQKLIDDQDQPGSVKDAARNYRVGIEKLAIYGRLFSERQAILAQEVRELGSLLLSKMSVKQKQNQLDSLGANLGEEAAAKKAVEAENVLRLREVGRTFYATFWGFRSALFYESLKWVMPSFAIPTSIGDIDELWKQMEMAKIEIDKLSRLPRMTTRVEISDPEILDSLKQNGSALLDIDLDNNRFASFDLLRVETLKMWLEGVTPDAGDGVKLGMVGAASLKNRSNGSDYSFTGQPVEASFYYDRNRKPTFEDGGFYITTTPFTTWTLRVENKPQLDLTGLTAVNIEFQGAAQKRR